MVGQAAFVLANFVHTDPVLAGTTVLTAIIALVAGVTWARNGRLSTLVTTTVIAGASALIPMEAPVPVGIRLLVGLGAVGVVGFLEFGHLATRLSSSPSAPGSDAQRVAARRLALALSIVAALLAASLLAPLYAHIVSPPSLAYSIEVATGPGVVLAGLLLCLILLTAARVLDARARRGVR